MVDSRKNMYMKVVNAIIMYIFGACDILMNRYSVNPRLAVVHLAALPYDTATPCGTHCSSGTALTCKIHMLNIACKMDNIPKW